MYLLLNFITCGSIEVTANQANGQETQVAQLDTIAVEEESGQEPRRSSRGKCEKGKNYDVNVTRVRRRGWFRRNKIAPAVLSTAEEGPSGTQGGQHGVNLEIFENKPVEASDDHVLLGFCEAQDSFTRMQNGALALQSIATCARLNENFMRKAAWTPTEGSDSNVSDNQETTTKLSFSSKISNTWKGFKRSISRRDSHVTAKGEAGPSNENTHEAQEKTVNPRETKKGLRKLHFRRKSRKGNSSKVTRHEPVRGIQELGENDSTFDRDLYMQVNNLAVTHDTCQSVSRDPFFIQEEIPTLSEVPMDYLAINLGEEDCWKCTKKKSRCSAFLARFKRRKKQL